MDIVILSDSANERLFRMTQNLAEQCKDHNVIIVEDDPEEKHEKSGAKVIHPKGEFNISARYQAGVDKGTHDIVALCQNDIAFSNDALKQVEKAFKENESIDSICLNDGTIEPVKKNFQKQDIPYSHCIFIRRKALKKVGLNLDAKFQDWEIDLAHRYSEHKIKHKLLLTERCIHLNGGGNTLKTKKPSWRRKYVHEQRALLIILRKSK